MKHLISKTDEAKPIHLMRQDGVIYPLNMLISSIEINLGVLVQIVPIEEYGLLKTLALEEFSDTMVLLNPSYEEILHTASFYKSSIRFLVCAFE